MSSFLQLFVCPLGPLLVAELTLAHSYHWSFVLSNGSEPVLRAVVWCEKRSPMHSLWWKQVPCSLSLASAWYTGACWEVGSVGCLEPPGLTYLIGSVQTSGQLNVLH